MHTIRKFFPCNVLLLPIVCVFLIVSLFGVHFALAQEGGETHGTTTSTQEEHTEVSPPPPSYQGQMEGVPPSEDHEYDYGDGGTGQHETSQYNGEGCYGPPPPCGEGKAPVMVCPVCEGDGPCPTMPCTERCVPHDKVRECSAGERRGWREPPHEGTGVCNAKPCEGDVVCPDGTRCIFMKPPSCPPNAYCPEFTEVPGKGLCFTSEQKAQCMPHPTEFPRDYDSPPPPHDLCKNDSDCPRGEQCTAGREDCWSNPDCGRGGPCEDACFGKCVEGGEWQGEEPFREPPYGAPGGNERFSEGCGEEVIIACKERCEVTDIPGCVEMCVMRKAEEGQCDTGSGKSGEVRGEGPRHEERRGGCRPFMREDAKWKLVNMGEEPTPGRIEEMYKEMTQRWIEEVSSKHDVNLSPEEAEHFPLCPRGPQGPGGGEHEYQGPGGQGDFEPEFQRFDGYGPQMGPPGGPGPGGGSVGEVFGRAVGMLVELSQQKDLSDDEKALVRESLTWFSAAMSEIAGGGDIGTLVIEAKDKLRTLMENMGGGPGFGPPPDRERVLKEISRHLTEAEGMFDMIPRAFAMMSEMGYEVPGWEEVFASIKEHFSAVKDTCEKIMESGDGDFQTCFEGMSDIFEHEMEDRLVSLVMEHVPQEVMDEVGKKMGFDDHGPPQDEGYGPPPGGWEEGPPMGDEMYREMKEKCWDMATGGGTEEKDEEVMRDCLKKNMGDEFRMGPSSGMEDGPHRGPGMMPPQGMPRDMMQRGMMDQGTQHGAPGMGPAMGPPPEIMKFMEVCMREHSKEVCMSEAEKLMRQMEDDRNRSPEEYYRGEGSEGGYERGGYSGGEDYYGEEGEYYPEFYPE